VAAPGRAGGGRRLAAGRRPRACCAAGGRRLPGPHHPARRGAPPPRWRQVSRQQGLGRVAAGAAPTGPLRHLMPSERAPVTGGGPGPRGLPPRFAWPVNLRGGCRPAGSARAGVQPHAPPSSRLGPLLTAASAVSAKHPVPPAVRPPRGCKNVSGAACGPHRGHPLL
jgi:hypothetical protein